VQAKDAGKAGSHLVFDGEREEEEVPAAAQHASNT
jgi:hypothetical protein